MEQSTISPITDLETVKNSNAFYVGNEFICMHYKDVIFRAMKLKSPSIWHITELYVPSMTSAKMAKRCYDYLNIRESWNDAKKRFNQ